MNVKWLWSRFIWHWGKRRNKSSKNSATFSSVSTWFETKRNISVWYNGWEIHSQFKSIKKEPWWEHLHSFPIEKHKKNLDCSEKSKVEDGKKGERNQHLRYQDQEENVGENEAWGYIHIYIIYIYYIYIYIFHIWDWGGRWGWGWGKWGWNDEKDFTKWGEKSWQCWWPWR